MIQELFQGSQPSLLSPSAASLYPLAPPPSANNNISSTQSSENPRCPRCDSSNTKFCYYNNYNLTQPRHFCKTCRRYWTKGGALRNVPIGGGCRKNKTTTSSIGASLTKSNAARILKTITSSEIEYAGLNHDISPNIDPIFWTSPQTSQLFSLMREKQNPNPKPSAYPISMKGEGFLVGTNMSLGSVIANTTFNSTRSLGFITPSQTAPFDLASSSSYLRNNHQQNYQGGGGGVTGDFSGGGFQEMYLQRIKSPTNGYPEHNGPIIFSNVASSTCMSTSPILDSAPLAGGGATDSSFLWGSSISWCDTPTTNCALPQGSSRVV